jgi:hypothetical protein
MSVQGSDCSIYGISFHLVAIIKIGIMDVVWSYDDAATIPIQTHTAGMLSSKPMSS